MPQLYNVDSPINREQRNNINSTFEDIQRRFSSLRNQIAILAGGADLEAIIQRLEDAINDANTNTANAQQTLETINQALSQLQSALDNSNDATNNANNAVADVRAEIITLQDFINQLGNAETYDITKTYQKNNVIEYNGSSFMAIQQTTGNLPPTLPLKRNDYWQLLAQRGVDGNGSVSSVNGLGPDINGDVILTTSVIGAASATEFATLNTNFNNHVQQTVSVKDFGALGNNSNDDTEAIQAAIDFVESRHGTVFFPDGNYVITRSLRLPSFVTLQGSSTSGAVINNQFTTLDAPQIVNKDPEALVYATVRNLTLRGGTYGIKLDVNVETSGNKFIDVAFQLQTVVNFQVNKLLQTTIFENCSFENASYGVYCQAFTANANNFINCSFTDHEFSHVTFMSSEVNNFVGCRFEGGGRQGRATITVDDTRNLKFDGCYFEGTHTKLIVETNSFNSVHFDNCHFTGAKNGGDTFVPYEFESNGIINFGNNTWGVRSNGANTMHINGINGNNLGGNNQLVVNQSHQYNHIVSKWIRTPATLQKDLFNFQRLNTNSSLENIQMITGILTINFLALEDGGFELQYSRKYHLSVRGLGSNAMKINITLASSADSPRAGKELTVRAKEGLTASSATIEAVFTGLSPTTEISSGFQYSLEYTQFSTLPDQIITASVL